MSISPVTITERLNYIVIKQDEDRIIVEDRETAERLIQALTETFRLDETPKCEVAGCTEDAYYEGWYRVLDFARVPTGLIQKRKVCQNHASVLIGAEK